MATQTTEEVTELKTLVNLDSESLFFLSTKQVLFNYINKPDIFINRSVHSAGPKLVATNFIVNYMSL